MFQVQLRQCFKNKTHKAEMTKVHAKCREMARTAHLTCAQDKEAICVIEMLK